MKRRNFIRSVIAAVALSPLIIRAKETPIVEVGRFHVRIESDDVTVADYFTNEHTLPPVVPYIFGYSVNIRDTKGDWAEFTHSKRRTRCVA